MIIFSIETIIKVIFPSLGATLLPDFFLDVGPEELHAHMVAAGAKPKFNLSGQPAEAAPASEAAGPADTFKTINSMITPDLMNSMKGTLIFDLKGMQTLTFFKRVMLVVKFLIEIRDFCLYHSLRQGSDFALFCASPG